MKRVLVTGGSGFIGNAVVKFLSKSHDVVVLDNFSPQIHGENHEESFLYRGIKDLCTVHNGDVCSPEDVASALNGVDAVIHLAAETGTGQSMYELNRYTRVNILGTSNLLETILKNKLPVKKIILSSSRSVYGEGMYSCGEHGTVVPDSRRVQDMLDGDFEPKCPSCGRPVSLLRTAEDCELKPISYYAYTKMAQEKMLELMAPSMGIAYTIFRYQNVYGAGQSLSNPYTGILSIFSKSLIQGKPINVFEDGLESRDFVHVNDVAAATCSALDRPSTDNRYINVGSGESVSILTVAETLKRLYGSDSPIGISGDFRKGDIRHNIADISAARGLCGYSPVYGFEQGMGEFTDWVRTEFEKNRVDVSDSSYRNSIDEMITIGMLFQKGDGSVG